MTDLHPNVDKYRELLLNERSFGLLFCDLARYPVEHLSLYSNKEFHDDPIFNHFIFDESILNSSESIDSEKLTSSFDRAKLVQSSSGLLLSIFVEDFWSRRQEVEKSAVESGYMVMDQMEILSKPISQSESGFSDISDKGALGNTGASVEITDKIEVWNEIFVRSFGIPNSWTKELLRRETAILEKNQASFILANMHGEKSKPGGCLLAFKMPSDCMGIYCVGTLNEFRGRGVARAMLLFTEAFAEGEGCELLGLQTLSSDHVSPMYQRMGYSTDFQRDILMRPP